MANTGIVKGAGEFTAFDRTGNIYGMEAWVYVGQSEQILRGVCPSGRNSIGYKSISPQVVTINPVDDERMEDDRGGDEVPMALGRSEADLAARNMTLREMARTTMVTTMTGPRISAKLMVSRVSRHLRSTDIQLS